MLKTLIYGSTAHHDMSNSELMDILTISESNNKKKNVTGMLLYKNRNFIQVLEGEEDVVDKLYEKIAQDPRHHSVTIIFQRPLNVRDFGNWQMGFVNMESAEHIDKPGYTDFLKQSLAPAAFYEAPSHVHIFLMNFRDFMR